MTVDEFLKDCDWKDIVGWLESKKVYVLDGDDEIACNIPANLLKKEYHRCFGDTISKASDVVLKKELETRGWTVKCTRTKTEEL